MSTMTGFAAGADGSRPEGILFEASCWAEIDAFLFGPPTASGETHPQRSSQVSQHLFTESLRQLPAAHPRMCVELSNCLVLCFTTVIQQSNARPVLAGKLSSAQSALRECAVLICK